MWAAGGKDDLDYGRHSMFHAWRQHLRYDHSNFKAAENRQTGYSDPEVIRDKNSEAVACRKNESFPVDSP